MICWVLRGAGWVSVSRRCRLEVHLSPLLPRASHSIRSVYPLRKIREVRDSKKDGCGCRVDGDAPDDANGDGSEKELGRRTSQPLRTEL